MNKAIFTLTTFLVFLLMSNLSQAQKNVEEGTIRIELNKIESDNPQMASQLEMMKGSEMIFAFDKENSLVKTSMFGGMTETKNLTNLDSGESKVFMNMMGNKILIESGKEDKEEAKKMVGEMEVKYDKEDTKTILGYECHKATITMGQEGMNLEVYVSPDLKVKSNMIQGLEDIELEGLPLEFTVQAAGVKMTYEAQEIEETVDKAVFDISEEGYEKMTMEEFQKKMGSMGGLGF